MDHHAPAPDLDTMGTASPRELLQHLRGCEGLLPTALRRPLVTASATVVPPLIALEKRA